MVLLRGGLRLVNLCECGDRCRSGMDSVESQLPVHVIRAGGWLSLGEWWSAAPAGFAAEFLGCLALFRYCCFIVLCYTRFELLSAIFI